MYVYLIETKAVHFSAFPPLFYLTLVIVRRFDTVNHLDIRWRLLTPNTCSGSPASSFPGLRKAGQAAGNGATWQHICLGAQVSRVIKVRTFLRGLDEVCQLLHEVGQLLYEVHLLTASGGVWQAGTSSVGKYNPLIFYSYNQL